MLLMLGNNVHVIVICYTMLMRYKSNIREFKQDLFVFIILNKLLENSKYQSTL